MIVQIDRGLHDYIDATDAITARLRAENGPVLETLRAFAAHFAKTLWRDASDLSPIAMMLSLNAYMLFLAGFGSR
jgi:hypothetical protein